MLRIGLTGGIASGKSTVAELFASLGAEIIDTDQIARELVEPGSPALAEITERFGAGILTDQGRLDRGSLRRIIFADAGAREDLEAILHPAIRREALDRASRSTAPYVIFVVPLLFETGFSELVDRTVTTDCPEQVQRERLMARDGISAAEADAIIAAQIDRQQRCSRADDVIDTATDIESTTDRVAGLHAQYSRISENCPQHEARAE